MITKKSLDSVLDQSIILTKTAPNDNAKSISVQCAPPLEWTSVDIYIPPPLSTWTKGHTSSDGFAKLFGQEILNLR